MGRPLAKIRLFLEYQIELMFIIGYLKSHNMQICIFAYLWYIMDTLTSKGTNVLSIKGSGGIRTHDTRSGISTYQADALSLSATLPLSPHRKLQVSLF